MNRCTPSIALALIVCLAVAPVQARTDLLTCGTHSETNKEALALHQRSTTRFGPKFRSLSTSARQAAAGQYALADVGDVAVVSAADGVLSRRNAFNLEGKTVRFLPTTDGRYRFETVTSVYDADARARGTLAINLGDDDTAAYNLPFSFPFYGATYQSLWLNSDGNLTFTGSDVVSGERSLGRFSAGLPRIAPIFADLDPSKARDGVRVLSESGRFVATWSQVPPYSSSGSGTPLTFQVALYPDGRIEFSYLSMPAIQGVVGISPGKAPGRTSIVSFLSNQTGLYTTPIGERFSSADEIDTFTVAQKFYLTHEDAYDYLAVYNALGVSAGSTAVAYEVTVRNNRTGYGDIPVDVGIETGSQQRLQSLLNMGPLSQYPSDPNAVVPARGTTGDSTMTVLGHEMGHLFLAYASVPGDTDPSTTPMLGRDGAHWAFTFNSDASLLEGNRIRDNGAGASPRFTTTATVQGYSALDQYLMGFTSKDSVPPFFYVKNATVSASRAPQVNVSFNGDRRDVTVDELINEVGRRTPDNTVAQHRFRVGMVLVVPEGQTATADQIARVEAVRSGLAAFYDRVTNGNASIDTRLTKALHVSAFSAVGVLRGGRVAVTVRLENPASSPLTLLFHQQNGAVGLPNSVTVPAGSTTATAYLDGAREGTDEVTVSVAEGGFENAVFRVQVASPASNKLVLAAGDKQTVLAGRPLATPLVVKLTDANDLPYPGVTVTSATQSGIVSPGSVVTDENGLATFTWNPAARPYEVRFTAATGAAVTATALGSPSIAQNGVVNGASFTTEVAPGSIATVFGANLNAGGSDVDVSVNGISTFVFYAGSDQINFLVPPSVPAGTAQISINTANGQSTSANFLVTKTAPGIFFDAKTGYGAILNNLTSQWIYTDPVSARGYMQIYATGFDGAFSGNVTQVFLGSTSIPVTYSGLAPGFTGLNQINVQVPAGTPAGVYDLTLVINGVRSNSVKVWTR